MGPFLTSFTLSNMLFLLNSSKAIMKKWFNCTAADFSFQQDLNSISKVAWCLKFTIKAT